jgi:hypothetical protein
MGGCHTRSIFTSSTCRRREGERERRGEGEDEEKGRTLWSYRVL